MNDSIFGLWQTGRVIANENRLRLLWQIFENSDQCVGELADAIGLSHPGASNQLRILCDEGLIQDHRSGAQVFYKAGSEFSAEYIVDLLTALRASYNDAISFESIIRQATGVTHQRRIELLRRIANAPLSIDELMDETAMSYGSLVRHLHKLTARNYISLDGKHYSIGTPRGSLATALMKIITS